MLKKGHDYVLIRHDLTTEQELDPLVIPLSFWGELMSDFLRIGTVLDRNESMFNKSGFFALRPLDNALNAGALVFLFHYRSGWGRIVRVSMQAQKRTGENW